MRNDVDWPSEQVTLTRNPFATSNSTNYLLQSANYPGLTQLYAQARKLNTVSIHMARLGATLHTKILAVQYMPYTGDHLQMHLVANVIIIRVTVSLSEPIYSRHYSRRW